MIDVELWEDNGGGLFLAFGDRVFHVSGLIGDDALGLMRELWETRAAVTWEGIDEYSRALSNVFDHPETRMIARYDESGFMQTDRPGNAGRAFLGQYAKDGDCD